MTSGPGRRLLDAYAKDKEARAAVIAVMRDAQEGKDLPDDVGGLMQRVAEVDAENAEVLREVLAAGWPSRSAFGDEATDALVTMLSHHAPPDVVELGFERARAGAEGGAISPHDLACLEDRIRVLRGEPQRYGTQWRTVGDEFQPFPIEDPEGVEQRRAEVGMKTMAEHLELIRSEFGTRPATGFRQVVGESPPED